MNDKEKKEEKKETKHEQKEDVNNKYELQINDKSDLTPVKEKKVEIPNVFVDDAEELKEIYKPEPKVEEVDVYWKLDSKGKAKLAIKITKGKRITVIFKDPKYLKSLRGHLQTVAKFGLRKNFI